MSQHFVHIPSLPKPEELSEIDGLLANAKFVDGKASATLPAQSVKNNLQLDTEGDELADIRSILGEALKTSPLFGVAALLYGRSPNAPETTLLLQAHANLFRMWSEA